MRCWKPLGVSCAGLGAFSCSHSASTWICAWNRSCMQHGASGSATSEGSQMLEALGCQLRRPGCVQLLAQCIHLHMRLEQVMHTACHISRCHFTQNRGAGSPWASAARAWARSAARTVHPPAHAPGTGPAHSMPHQPVPLQAKSRCWKPLGVSCAGLGTLSCSHSASTCTCAWNRSCIQHCASGSVTSGKKRGAVKPLGVSCCRPGRVQLLTQRIHTCAWNRACDTACRISTALLRAAASVALRGPGEGWMQLQDICRPWR